MQAKRIPLYGRDGVVAWATVDAGDYDDLIAYRWHRNDTGYARRNALLPDRGMVLMHRQIMGLGRGDRSEIDHINRDTLDNRRANLRMSTHAQNKQNLTSYRGSSSKYRGVCWNKANRNWIASATIAGRTHHIGSFANEDDAGLAASAFRAKHMPFSSDAQRAA